jgi:hypothetical protein
MGVPIHDTATIGALASSEIVEASGLAASRAHPGVLYTMTDSGHDPVLYAIDLHGADVGSWVVEGATNTDWEAIAVGPCASAEPAPPSCVYIGDTGDNHAHHRARTIYRVEEPALTSPVARGTISGATALVYRYPDGPRDVEAMYAGHDGSVWLISKRALRDAAGGLRQALVFRLTPAMWGRQDVQDAELVDSLPIRLGSAPLREITDASLAPDGTRVAVRTYTQVFLFEADSTTGRIRTDIAPVTCNLAPLMEEQGEAVAWRAAGDLVLLSEGKHASLHGVKCYAPA